MRTLIMVVLGVMIANHCHAQGLLNRRMFRPYAEEQKFEKTYPSGTNEFGRIWKVQCEYEKFMRENPDGKNKLGLTFDEQQKKRRMIWRRHETN